jgi:methyltransferase
VTPLYWTLAVVALQRLAELAWACRNTARLRRLGAIERRRRLPALYRAACRLAREPRIAGAGRTPPAWPLLGLFAVLQPARIWVVLSLGRYWTTRLLPLPGAPLVRAGPYRWIRHPNYLFVAAEIAILPLAFGAVSVAAAFSALNLALIARRIALEDRVLAARRAL